MFARFVSGLRKRVLAFVDPTVLLLLGVGALIVWLVDPTLAKTLLQWGLFLFAIAAFVVIASLLVFQHISFDEWIAEAKKGNPVAGQIFIAVAIYMGLVFVGACIFVRAV